MSDLPGRIGFIEPGNILYKDLLESISEQSDIDFRKLEKGSEPFHSEQLLIFDEGNSEKELAIELSSKSNPVILLTEKMDSADLLKSQGKIDLIYFNSKSANLSEYLSIQIEHIIRRNILLQELKKANKQLNKYIYSITHDLKAPLTSLLGLTEILKNGDETIPQLDFFNLMERSIGRMEDHIETTLDYYRNQLTDVVPKKVDIASFIGDLVESQKHYNQIVQIHTDFKGEKSFITDPLRLRVALSNLISNAIKYGNKGMGEYLVFIKSECTSDALKISVIDKGPGIDISRQKSLFDLFSGEDDNMHTGGIGLFLAKDATEKIDGQIELNSKLGEGSEFVIRLPSLNLEIS